MGKWKLRIAIVCLIAMAMTIISQTTLAFYTVVDTATNVVTSGEIKLKIHEKTASGDDFPAEGVYVIPGDIVSKIVSVENQCSHPFYLRVKLINSADRQTLDPLESLKVNINTEKWILQPDGFLYYTEILQPGQISEPVFTQVEVVGSQLTQDHGGATLLLTVSAHAVQSEHNPAEHPWDASGWPAD